MTDLLAPRPDVLRVLLVGLGVVGLPLARQLAQARHLLLVACDFDVIEAGNLHKQRWDADQVDTAKCEAARQLIARQAPQARVLPWPHDVRGLGVGAVRGFDLLVGAMDNRAADLHAAALAAMAGIPYVRMATRGEERGVDVRFVPPPLGGDAPCGACVFSKQDLDRIEEQVSCGCDVETFDEAGALTFAEHGTLAASLAADSIRRGEFGPARVIRYLGGPFPTVDGTHITRSRICPVGGLTGPHGVVDLGSPLGSDPDACAVGDVFEAAGSRLDCAPSDLLMEFDSPLTRISFGSRCSGCEHELSPHFHAPGKACPRCAAPVEQDRAVLGQALAASQLHAILDHPLASLGAPMGLGLRFRSSSGRRWCTHVAPGALNFFAEYP